MATLICEVATGVAPDPVGQVPPGSRAYTDKVAVPAVEPSATVTVCEIAAPPDNVNVAARLVEPAAVKNEFESASATVGSSTGAATLEPGANVRTRQPFTVPVTCDASVTVGWPSDVPLEGPERVIASGFTETLFDCWTGEPAPLSVTNTVDWPVACPVTNTGIVKLALDGAAAKPFESVQVTVCPVAVCGQVQPLPEGEELNESDESICTVSVTEFAVTAGPLALLITAVNVAVLPAWSEVAVVVTLRLSEGAA